MSLSARWSDDLRMSLRVAARYQRSFEFSSPEALKKYLHDHPGADKSKHTVKKPGEHEKKEDKPKASWKDIMKGLSSKAVSFVKKAPEHVKKFVHDENFRMHTLLKAHDAIKKAPAEFVKSAWEQAKDEVKEFKEAGEGVKTWMDGKEMSKEQKSAFRKVATHVAVAAAAGALGAGLGASAAALGKGVLGSFISSTAKKIAIKAVTERLEHLPMFEELHHIVEHGSEVMTELMHKLADEDKSKASPDKVMQMMIAAAVAKEIKNLDPEMMQEALEEAADSESV